MSLQQRGFTLVEAMVAIMILSVGMVGLAYLQATGMRFTTTSYQRTQASILAADYLDVIRSRPQSEAANFTLTRNAGGQPPACDATSATPDAEKNCWVRHLVTAIPSASADVSVAAVNDPPGTEVTVDIRWQELEIRAANGGNNTAEPQTVDRSFISSTRLPD